MNNEDDTAESCRVRLHSAIEILMVRSDALVDTRNIPFNPGGKLCLLQPQTPRLGYQSWWNKGMGSCDCISLVTSEL